MNRQKSSDGKQVYISLGTFQLFLKLTLTLKQLPRKTWKSRQRRASFRVKTAWNFATQQFSIIYWAFKIVWTLWFLRSRALNTVRFRLSHCIVLFYFKFELVTGTDYAEELEIYFIRNFVTRLQTFECFSQYVEASYGNKSYHFLVQKCQRQLDLPSKVLYEMCLGAKVIL